MAGNTVRRSDNDWEGEKKERARRRSFFLRGGKALCREKLFDMYKISEVKIFLEFSHLQGRERQKESEAETASNRYHPQGLTAAITLNCSLKTTLFALLGDKVIIHCRTS